MRNLTFDFVKIKGNKFWNIQFNKLTSLDPEDENLTQEELEHYSLGLLTQDLFQANSKSHFIDLGWYPDSEIKGEFWLKVLSYNGLGAVDWNQPIFEFKTKSLEKMLVCVETIMGVLKK